jgi:hypothetical protein
VTTLRPPSSALTSFVVASRYMPVFLAIILLVIVANRQIVAGLTRGAVKG